MVPSSSSSRSLQGNRHHWLAVAIFGGILIVWGLGMTVALNATSVDDAHSGTVVSVFTVADEKTAMAAIRAAGGLLVDNPARGTWVVHAEQPGLAGRLRAAGALGVFDRLPVALPGASGCFFLPDGQRTLFGRQPGA
jgi:hypothetical protein